ncbi:MAG: hypothetical protein F2750_04165 [Actinobacteria bacterium]|uniref:Unannotated protein n=1 Tax=freshwater metagenome TaxID=449393 RepID=A0A6J6Z8G5_9ZZZZ|nr:hypothetical protein [Actinomycetota bacterium]
MKRTESRTMQKIHRIQMLSKGAKSIGEVTTSRILKRLLSARDRISNSQGFLRFNDKFLIPASSERGDVPGWVLVVLMTTGLVTAIWTIAAPRLTSILKNSLDAMNGIR